MRVIHKFSLQPGENRLVLRLGWTPLSFQTQRGQLMLWVIINTKEREVAEAVHVFVTGEDLPNWARRDTYLGTTQLEVHPFQGSSPPVNLVYHAFRA